MRLRNIFYSLGIFYILYKLANDLVLVRKRETDRIFIKMDGEEAEPTVVFNDNEDILDELESLDKPMRNKVVNELSEGSKDARSFKEQITDKVWEDLNDRQINILKLLESEGKIDTTFLSKNIKDVTVRTLRRDLDALSELGLVEKVGETKGSYYVKI